MVELKESNFIFWIAVCFLSAEGEGFEPSDPLQVGSLAESWFKPLTHTSISLQHLLTRSTVGFLPNHRIQNGMLTAEEAGFEPTDRY